MFELDTEFSRYIVQTIPSSLLVLMPCFQKGLGPIEATLKQTTVSLPTGLDQVSALYMGGGSPNNRVYSWHPDFQLDKVMTQSCGRAVQGA